MTIELELTSSTNVPLEVEGITPDRIRELSTDDVARLEVFEGNERSVLGDHFRVQGSPSDETIVFRGNLAGVHWIGAKMESGLIRIEGPAGRHIGSEMSGGKIETNDDVGDWVGAEMSAGTIRVRGRAGHLVGAAYRGSARGMRGGSIVIDGDAGNEVGHTMRRGLIAIGGSVGDLTGFNMLAGTIVIGGSAGIRHGAGMRRGTLVFLADEGPEPLPTFAPGGRQPFPMMGLLSTELRKLGYAAAERLQSALFDLYHGDGLEGGRGELLIRVGD